MTCALAILGKLLESGLLKACSIHGLAIQEAIFQCLALRWLWVRGGRGGEGQCNDRFFLFIYLFLHLQFSLRAHEQLDYPTFSYHVMTYLNQITVRIFQMTNKSHFWRGKRLYKRPQPNGGKEMCSNVKINDFVAQGFIFCMVKDQNMYLSKSLLAFAK